MDLYREIVESCRCCNTCDHIAFTHDKKALCGLRLDFSKRAECCSMYSGDKEISVDEWLEEAGI